MSLKQLIIYRPQWDMEFKQDVETWLYNINDILEAYNKHYWEEKRMDNYLANQTTRDYILFLEWKEQEQANKLNTWNSSELELSQEQAIVNFTPRDGVIKTKRGKFWGTRVNKHLVVDFMMWLSVEFKHLAIEMILHGDQLAFGRHKIKEWYKQMCKAIASCWACNYAQEAMMISDVWIWSRNSNQRARYSENEQNMIDDIQKANATLINAWIDIEKRKELLQKQFK